MEGFAELADRQLQEGALSIQVNQLANAIDGINPTQRGQRGGNQQPVIAARIAPHQRGGGEGAHSVGEQPLVVDEWMEMAVGLEGKERHGGIVDVRLPICKREPMDHRGGRGGGSGGGSMLGVVSSRCKSGRLPGRLPEAKVFLVLGYKSIRLALHLRRVWVGRR